MLFTRTDTGIKIVEHEVRHATRNSCEWIVPEHAGKLNSTQIMMFVCLFVCLRDIPQWATASSFASFLDHTQRRTTIARTPLDEWSARRRKLYLTTHNRHNRQASMPPVGFEPTISACERPRTFSLDCANTETGTQIMIMMMMIIIILKSWLQHFKGKWEHALILRY